MKSLYYPEFLLFVSMLLFYLAKENSAYTVLALSLAGSIFRALFNYSVWDRKQKAKEAIENNTNEASNALTVFIKNAHEAHLQNIKETIH